MFDLHKDCEKGECSYSIGWCISFMKKRLWALGSFSLQKRMLWGDLTAAIQNLRELINRRGADF